jgi:hypothetical protein
VPKNLAGAMLLDRLGPPGFRFMVSAGAMLLDRLGPAGFRFTDFRAPR